MTTLKTAARETRYFTAFRKVLLGNNGLAVWTDCGGCCELNLYTFSIYFCKIELQVGNRTNGTLKKCESNKIRTLNF